jgi:hypothetical protein
LINKDEKLTFPIDKEILPNLPFSGGCLVRRRRKTIARGITEKTTVGPNILHLRQDQLYMGLFQKIHNEISDPDPRNLL